MFNQNLIEQIVEANDIVSTIEQYVPLRKSGTNFKACCPFHEEKTPSFTVSERKQIYKCFGCGKGGNVLNFVKDIEKISFYEAIEKLAKNAGITLKQTKDKNSHKNSRIQLIENIYDLAKDYYCSNLERFGEKVITYLKNRNISIETANKFQLGYTLNSTKGLHNYLLKKNINENIMVQSGLIVKSKYGHYDLFRDRLIFPIHSSTGKVVAFGARVLSQDTSGAKYINSPTTPIYTKGNELYGFYQTRSEIGKKNGAIITEGYLDFIRLYESGFINSVASLGTSLTEKQIQLISRYTSNYYLLFDGDKAGRKAALEAAKKIIVYGKTPFIVDLPQDEDADSYIQSQGIDSLAVLIDNAKSLPQYLYDDEILGHSKTEKLEYLINLMNDSADLLTVELFLNDVAGLFNVSPQALIGRIKRKQTTRPEQKGVTNNESEARNQYIEEKVFLCHLINGSVTDTKMYEEITADHFFIEKYKKIFELLTNDGYYIDRRKIMSILSSLENKDDLIANTISSLLFEADHEMSVEEAINDLKLRKLRIEKELNPIKDDEDSLTERLRELEKANEELKRLSSNRLKKILY